MSARVGTALLDLDIDVRGAIRQVGRAFASMPPVKLDLAVDRSAARSVFERVEADASSAGREAASGFSSRFSSGLGGVSDGLKDKLKLGGVAAATAAGAVVSAAFVRSMDVEAANDKLAAQLGASGTWAKDLGKVAGDLYSGAFGDSLEQVNEAVRKVLQDGLVSEDASNKEIEAITGKVMNLATAFDEDLGGATRAIGQLMKTGLARNASEALDVVTRGFQQGVDRSEDFLDTLNEYSTQFRKLGLDAKTATGLLSQGLRAGARDSDVVADSLKEFSIRAIDGSKLTAQGFKALGLDAARMAATFSKGGPAASKGLDVVLDRLRAMKNPTEQAQAAVALFGTQAEDLGKALYALDPSDAVNALGRVGGAADKMGKTLNDNASTNIEAFKRKVMTGLTNYIGTSVIPAFNRLSARIGVVVSDVQQKVHGFFNAGSENGGRLKAVLDNVSSAFDSVKSAISGLVTIGTALWDRFGSTLTDSLRSTVTNISTIFGGVLRIVKGVIDVVAGVLTGDWSRAWDGIKSIFSGVWQAIRGILAQAWNSLKTVIGLGIDAVKGLVSGGWSAIRGLTTTAWNAIKGGLSSAWNTIRSGASSAWNAIKTAVTTPIRVAVGLVSSAVNTMKSVATTAWRGLVSVARTLWNAVKTAITTPINEAAKLLRSAVERFVGIGGDIVRGIVRGIVGAAKSVIGAIGDLVSGAIGKAKDLLGISSPSKVFEQFGRYVGEGFIKGVTGTREQVISTMQGLSTAISAAMRSDDISATRKTALGALAARVVTDRKLLLAEVGKVNSVTKQLETAQENLKSILQARSELMASVSSSILGSAGGITSSVTDVLDANGDKTGSTTTSDAIIASLQGQLAATEQFGANVAYLAQQGLNSTSIQQITSAGVEIGGATAAALVQAGAASIAAVNTLQGKLQTAAEGIGNVTAGSLYDAGVRSAQGLVAGLTSQEGEIEKTLVRIARRMQKAIKKALGIKSPSTVFAALGANVSEGFARGIEANKAAVTTAVQGLAITPRLTDPSPLTSSLLPSTTGSQLVGTGMIATAPTIAATEIEPAGGSAALQRHAAALEANTIELRAMRQTGMPGVMNTIADHTLERGGQAAQRRRQNPGDPGVTALLP